MPFSQNVDGLITGSVGRLCNRIRSAQLKFLFCSKIYAETALIIKILCIFAVPATTPLTVKTLSLLKEFIDRYYPNVFRASARLTGITDKEELAKLTEDVLAVLWENRREFAAEERPGVFLYRILLQEIITFLRRRGEEERIRILRDIVLIDPALYLSEPPADLPCSEPPTDLP